MAEFMSDEDLEALKADTNAEMPASAQSTNGQVQQARLKLHTWAHAQTERTCHSKNWQ